LGVEAFFGELSGDGTECWAPVTAWVPQLGVWSAADTALARSKIKKVYVQDAQFYYQKTDFFKGNLCSIPF